jgi:Mg/Co/Ni transporter MgtE
MDNRELVAAAATLDTDEIADLAADLPKDVVQELMESLDVAKRAQVESSLSYDEDSVGVRSKTPVRGALVGRAPALPPRPARAN